MATYMHTTVFNGSKGVDKKAITDLRLNATQMVRKVTDKLSEQRDFLQILTSADSFRGQAASALSNHITTVVIPIINNEIEACARFKEEAERIQSAYDEVDAASDAVINYEEVNAAAFRLANLTNNLHEPHKSLLSIESEVAAIAAGIPGLSFGVPMPNFQPIERAYKQYDSAGKKLIERCGQHDVRLTSTINALREQIALIANVAKSARRRMHGRIPAQTQADIDALAWRAIRGEFGNGQARKDALGDMYDEVQQRVNELWDVNGGPKPGVTQPTETDHTPLDVIRARRATTDPLLGAEWEPLARNLPFGAGADGSVYERINETRLNTDDLRLNRPIGGVYVDIQEIKKQSEGYYDWENFQADPRASRVANMLSPEAAREAQHLSIRKGLDGKVYGIDLTDDSTFDPNQYSRSTGGK